jgi:hypothetical protein
MTFLKIILNHKFENEMQNAISQLSLLIEGAKRRVKVNV